MICPVRTGVGTEAVGYDAAGNMTSHPKFGVMKWDAEGRLVSSGGAVFAYDGEGRRVKKTVGGVATYYVYDGMGKLGAEYSASVTAASTRYLTSDHLGSTRVITDGAGVVRARCDYAPFGETLDATAALGNRDLVADYSCGDGTVAQRFTSHYRDAETGLDYMGARYFSGAAGRFVSPDPANLGARLRSPQSWNMYSYALNSPFRFVDPNGRWPTPIHNLIIDFAFPGLSPEQRMVLKKTSYKMDNIFRGKQGNTLAYTHAMRKPGQPVASARGAYNVFVAEKMKAAQEAQFGSWMNSEYGVFKNALELFGELLHAVTDETSPTHEGFQLWDWSRPEEVLRHIDGEETITQDQMHNAVNTARTAFLTTFGPTMFRIAVGEKELKPKVDTKINFKIPPDFRPKD